MAKYIYSTLTANNAYASYKQSGDGTLIMDKSVTIRGGTNVADKHLHTPYGVMTEVSEEEFEILRSDSGFQEHVRLGFLKVEEKPFGVEDVVVDMKDKDASAPKVDEDFAPESKPIVPEVEKEKKSLFGKKGK
jgi:hypothetical protein